MSDLLEKGELKRGERICGNENTAACLEGKTYKCLFEKTLNFQKSNTNIFLTINRFQMGYKF